MMSKLYVAEAEQEFQKTRFHSLHPHAPVKPKNHGEMTVSQLRRLQPF